jgi:hypothetical protein
MLLRIPEHVRATLEAEFSFQVRTAYTMHLNNKHVAFQATVPQAALPSVTPIVLEIIPAKADKPATETSGNNQGKWKASDAPPCPQQNSTNPLVLFTNATITIAASAAAAIEAVTTTATTTAAAGTSSANALEVPGTTLGNALTVHDLDSDATDDTLSPPMFPKKEHRFNSSTTIMPLAALYFGGIFFWGHNSLKNRTYCPLFSHDSTSFKNMCLLIKLKEAKVALYGPHLHCEPGK